MITGNDIYHSVAALVPLYVAMILAYLSIKWWKLFTPDQCAGLNKFVSKFSVPLLSFKVISKSNPYKMSLKLILSDSLQKILAIVVLYIFIKFRSRGNGNWLITGLSVSTLPNTLIVGIPLLKAMYGEEAEILLDQMVIFQTIIWYNLLLFLFEFNAANNDHSVVPGNVADVELQQMEGKGELEGRESEKLNKRKLIDRISEVGRKFMQNPNTHATIIGIIWACIKFKYHLDMPTIIQDSVDILADGGLGMAMFSLGLFIASQASIMACGFRLTVVTIALRFIMGPALMLASAAAFKLKSTTFKVAVVQAALPQGIVPFVFAKEYNVHPNIQSTGITFSMLIALPVTLVYYFTLDYL